MTERNWRTATWVIVALATFLCANAADGSLAYQIDAAHSGAIAFKRDFKPPLKRRWVRDLGGPVSYPLVVKGMIFVTVGDVDEENDHLLALNLRTGDTVWSRPLPSTQMWANAAYDSGRVFAVGATGSLQAFEADTGNVVWAEQIRNVFMPPLASEGLLYVSDTETGTALRAFDEVSGIQKWEMDLPTGIGPTAVGGGGLYYTPSGEYFRLDPATGSVVWHYELCCEGEGLTPVYHDGQLFVRDPLWSSVVLDAATGKLFGSLGAIAQPPAFWNGSDGQKLEFALFGDRLYAVDLDTGNVVWNFKGDKQLSTAPIVMNGLVVEGSVAGNLYLLDGKTGKILWSQNVGSAMGPPIEGPLTGFGAASGVLIVPANNQLSAYVSKN